MVDTALLLDRNFQEKRLSQFLLESRDSYLSYNLNKRVRGENTQTNARSIGYETLLSMNGCCFITGSKGIGKAAFLEEVAKKYSETCWIRTIKDLDQAKSSRIWLVDVPKEDLECVLKRLSWDNLVLITCETSDFYAQVEELLKGANEAKKLIRCYEMLPIFSWIIDNYFLKKGLDFSTRKLTIETVNYIGRSNYLEFLMHSLEGKSDSKLFDSDFYFYQEFADDFLEGVLIDSDDALLSENAQKSLKKLITEYVLSGKLYISSASNFKRDEKCYHVRGKKLDTGLTVISYLEKSDLFSKFEQNRFLPVNQALLSYVAAEYLFTMLRNHDLTLTRILNYYRDGEGGLKQHMALSFAFFAKFYLSQVVYSEVLASLIPETFYAAIAYTPLEDLEQDVMKFFHGTNIDFFNGILARNTELTISEESLKEFLNSSPKFKPTSELQVWLAMAASLPQNSGIADILMSDKEALKKIIFVDEVENRGAPIEVKLKLTQIKSFAQKSLLKHLTNDQLKEIVFFMKDEADRGASFRLDMSILFERLPHLVNDLDLLRCFENKHLSSSSYMLPKSFPSLGGKEIDRFIYVDLPEMFNQETLKVIFEQHTGDDFLSMLFLSLYLNENIKYPDKKYFENDFKRVQQELGETLLAKTIIAEFSSVPFFKGVELSFEIEREFEQILEQCVYFYSNEMRSFCLPRVSDTILRCISDEHYLFEICEIYQGKFKGLAKPNVIRSYFDAYAEFFIRSMSLVEPNYHGATIAYEIAFRNKSRSFEDISEKEKEILWKDMVFQNSLAYPQLQLNAFFDDLSTYSQKSDQELDAYLQLIGWAHERLNVREILCEFFIDYLNGNNFAEQINKGINCFLAEKVEIMLLLLWRHNALGEVRSILSEVELLDGDISLSAKIFLYALDEDRYADRYEDIQECQFYSTKLRRIFLGTNFQRVNREFSKEKIEELYIYWYGAWKNLPGNLKMDLKDSTQKAETCWDFPYGGGSNEFVYYLDEWESTEQVDLSSDRILTNQDLYVAVLDALNNLKSGLVDNTNPFSPYRFFYTNKEVKFDKETQVKDENLCRDIISYLLKSELNHIMGLSFHLTPEVQHKDEKRADIVIETRDKSFRVVVELKHDTNSGLKKAPTVQMPQYISTEYPYAILLVLFKGERGKQGRFVRKDLDTSEKLETYLKNEMMKTHKDTQDVIVWDISG